MAIEITVPRQGWSMEEGVFVEWRKHDGDRVRPGEPLYLLESEKATEEIEALDAGTLRIPSDAPKPGDKVVVGQLLAFLVAEGEEIPAISGEKAEPAAIAKPLPAATGPAARRLARSAAEMSKTAVSAPRSSVASAGTVTAKAEPRPKTISPRARRVARELGIDWNTIEGSGRTGRIRERDVRAATAGNSDGRLIPHTHIRRVIATRMLAGVAQAAPVTLTSKTDATNLVNLRQQFKATQASEDTLPGYTDMILKLTAAALRRHPYMQAQWRDEALWIPERIDIAFAVDTEAGLLVPAVRGVDRLTLRQIAAQTHTLADRARTGKLTADQMRGATFTITNLGSFGVDAFTPIIHLPQCAVLGVGRIVREPAVVNEQIVPRHTIMLSLTFDHRVVDGAPAARFLQAFRGCVEQPAPWLIP